MSTLSVAVIRDVQSFDFSNTEFAKAFDVSNAAFDQSNTAAIIANTALPNVSNAVFAGDLRVTGNLQIGTNTVTIRDNHIISAEYYRMNTANHMVAIPDGNRVNTIFSLVNVSFDTANASYNSANNVGPQIAPAFNTANLAFNAANNVGPQIAPTFNTANLAYTTSNAAFGKANTALQNTSGTFAGNLTVTGNADFSLGTSYLKLPVGTTSQRPVGAAGMIRFNSTTGLSEIYQYGSWNTVVASYSVEYLVVGGGGAGGGEYVGGGGGAGGYLSGTAAVFSTQLYSVVIGAGATGVNAVQVAASGSNSTALGLIAYGGGGGGVGNRGATVAQAASGGSGGGSGAYGSPSNFYGSGTAGQGNRGGSGWDGISSFTTAGGGGGAGGVGGNAGTSAPSNTGGGAGGVGLQWSNGTYYAGGGGGGTDNGAAGWSGLGGTGGTGGGGNGGSFTVYTAATNGSTNTGGGGGGSTRTLNTGGNGGSGIVIIRYAGSQKGSGGTVSSSGGYTYHTFTTSGTFTA